MLGGFQQAYALCIEMDLSYFFCFGTHRMEGEQKEKKNKGKTLFYNVMT